MTRPGAPIWSYVVPNGEDGAGATVEMRLLNEETLQLRVGRTAPFETWHRRSQDIG